jgi:hypothetical protein
MYQGQEPCLLSPAHRLGSVAAAAAAALVLLLLLLPVTNLLLPIRVSARRPMGRIEHRTKHQAAKRSCEEIGMPSHGLTAAQEGDNRRSREGGVWWTADFSEIPYLR